MVAYAQARRVRKVVEAALPLLARRGHRSCRARRRWRIRTVVWRSQNLARISIRLLNAKRACPRVSRIRKHIAHVVKQHKAYRVAKEGKHRRRQPQFRAVYQRARAANRKSRLGVARSRRIDREST